MEYRTRKTGEGETQTRRTLNEFNPELLHKSFHGSEGSVCEIYEEVHQRKYDAREKTQGLGCR